MNKLESDIKLQEVLPNIALMLERNVKLFGDRIVYQEKRNGNYEGITWNELRENILNIAVNLKRFGVSEGDKIIIYSPNCQKMLELELAVMASGGIAVPIFAYFHKETDRKSTRLNSSH